MKILSDIFLPQASHQCAEMPLGMAEELAQARHCLLRAVQLPSSGCGDLA